MYPCWQLEKIRKIRKYKFGKTYMRTQHTLLAYICLFDHHMFDLFDHCVRNIIKVLGEARVEAEWLFGAKRF